MDWFIDQDANMMVINNNNIIYLHQLKMCLDLDQLNKENATNVKTKLICLKKKPVNLDCEGSPTLGRDKKWKRMHVCKCKTWRLMSHA